MEGGDAVWRSSKAAAGWASCLELTISSRKEGIRVEKVLNWLSLRLLPNADFHSIKG